MLLPNNIDNITKSTCGNKFTDIHSSFTNTKRKEVNKLMMGKVVKEKRPLRLPALSYDKNSQATELLHSMPIIAKIQIQTFNKGSNQCFTSITINEEHIVIVDDDDDDKMRIISIPKNPNMSYVASCIAVCRSQGSTFNSSYTILEFDKYDENRC